MGRTVRNELAVLLPETEEKCGLRDSSRPRSRENGSGAGDPRVFCVHDPDPIRGEDPPFIGLIPQPLKDGPWCRSVHRSRRPAMPRKTFEIQPRGRTLTRY